MSEERKKEAIQDLSIREEEIKSYLRSLLREELGELLELIPQVKQALGKLDNIPRRVEETLGQAALKDLGKALHEVRGNGKGLSFPGELDLGKLITLQFAQHFLKTNADEDSWIEENIIKPLRKYAKIRDALSILEPPSPGYDLLFRAFADGLKKGTKLPLALGQKTSRPQRGSLERLKSSLSDELYKHKGQS